MSTITFLGTAADGPEQTLQGDSPMLGRVGVELHGERLQWRVDGVESPPSAGTGIPSAILDRVLRTSSARPPRLRERAITADQTHTSVIVDESWVVKIVGLWGAADRSATVLSRLQASEASITPDFAGALAWQHPEHGDSVIALVSAFVPGSADGWTWAVDDVLAFLEHRADRPTWPAELGRITGRLHGRLLLPEAEPGGPADPRGGDRSRASHMLERVLDQSNPTSASGRRLHARRPSLTSAIATIPSCSSSPLLISHGDLHVGQFLRTSSGEYFVIDFDGNPQWTAEQRLAPDGAARDVAHMMASIDLVAAAVQRRLGRADDRAWTWSKDAQQDYLGAYLSVADPEWLDAAALPGYIAEQLLTEIDYATVHLPAWHYAPDGVISARYPATTDSSEQAWNPVASSTT
ncbi:hypothetical protein ACFWN7_08955 [Agromyces sp. NPDC058484]|uniref:hypothetical protein n=1 Tax=Agromyces sp. NPDC058484 TaxID=3346524 RepID=UPI0036660D58